MQYDWAEDDFELPQGVDPLGGAVPEEGRRYIMYQGTTRQSADLIVLSGFRQSPDGMLGRGVYLSRDLQKARRYPLHHPDAEKVLVVLKVAVHVGRVIAINYQGHPRHKTWHDARYGPIFDNAWGPPQCGVVPSGLEEDCVWDPRRIAILDTIVPTPHIYA